MWVFVRTSTNFAHLTSFQAIEFMDGPVAKTLDISVCQTSKNKAFKMQHSVTVVHLLFAAKNKNTILSHPQSPRFPLGCLALCTINDNVTTWEEIKVQVRRIHLEIRLKDNK